MKKVAFGHSERDRESENVANVDVTAPELQSEEGTTSAAAMPGVAPISTHDFVREVREDFNSPTTSNFVNRIPQCKETVAKLEEVSHMSPALPLWHGIQDPLTSGVHCEARNRDHRVEVPGIFDLKLGSEAVSTQALRGHCTLSFPTSSSARRVL